MFMLKLTSPRKLFLTQTVLALTDDSRICNEGLPKRGVILQVAKAPYLVSFMTGNNSVPINRQCFFLANVMFLILISTSHRSGKVIEKQGTLTVNSNFVFWLIMP